MKIMRLLLAIALLGVSAFAQEAATFRKYADAAASVDKFSGTILVARKGNDLLQQSYGLADRAANTPNTDSTTFRIGSMSKSVTATAIMLLRDQGKLKLEDSVCTYIPSCPPAWKSVTLSNLLTHTSGVPDITKFPDFMTYRTIGRTPKQLVDHIAEQPTDFPPGSRFVYSNSNFILLGYVIENVTKTPYETFLAKNIFEPAGMTRSGYEENSKLPAAKGYVREGDVYRDPDLSDMSVRFSAGGLYSTTTDLMALACGLSAGKILKSSTVEEMWTDRGNGYGYGWFVENETNRKAVGHNGRIDGFASSFRLFRDEDLFIAVLSNVNGTNTERMSTALAAIAHGEPFSMPHEHKFVRVSTKTLDQYIGRYRLPWGLELIVTRDGERLMGRAVQERNPTEWKPESSTLFYVPPAGVEIEFVKDTSGKFTLLFDGSAKAERIGD